MRNLVGRADSMAKYSFLRVDGGRREKRILIHGLLVSQFLKSQYFFTRCVCEFFSLSENGLSRWRNIIVRDSLWHVKHLENDLNPIHSQPLFTCHKESLTMILLHIESQFSVKEKISYIHLVKKYWDFRNCLTTNLWFIILFSLLLPPSTLKNEYLAMLSDLPTKCLIPHTWC